MGDIPSEPENVHFVSVSRAVSHGKWRGSSRCLSPPPTDGSTRGGSLRFYNCHFRDIWGKLFSRGYFWVEERVLGWGKWGVSGKLGVLWWVPWGVCFIEVSEGKKMSLNVMLIGYIVVILAPIYDLITLIISVKKTNFTVRYAWNHRNLPGPWSRESECSSCLVGGGWTSSPSEQ